MGRRSDVLAAISTAQKQAELILERNGEEGSGGEVEGKQEVVRRRKVKKGKSSKKQ